MALGENERNELLELQKRMASLRKDMAKHMLLYGDEAGVYGDLEPPGTGHKPAPPESNSPLRRTSTEGAKNSNGQRSSISNAFPLIPTYADPLDSELRGLLARTETLLRPLLTHPGISALLSACASTPKASLVLLLDEQLLPLPVEGLSAISALPSVSRDFSLHVLNHRLALAREVNAGTSHLLGPVRGFAPCHGVR
jgi:hypothetical protein